MRRAVVELLAWLAVATALFVGGMVVGTQETNKSWKAKEADRLQAEAAEREAEWARGQDASRDLQTELLLQAITNEALRKAFDDFKRRNPIVVARRAVEPGPAASSGNGLQPPARQPPPGGDGLALTVGAVWMWNSALAGRDVPAGSCGLADTSPTACSAPTDITVDDAWDNHALNASICADTRIRYQRLIDYINTKGAPVPAQHRTDTQ